MGICNKNCLNCQHSDCVNDKLDYEDYLEEPVREEISHETMMARVRANRYAQAHREQNRKAAYNYYIKNKELYNERSRNWSAQNKDRVAAAKRKRWSDNPELYRQKQREYRAKKKLKAGGLNEEYINRFKQLSF